MPAEKKPTARKTAVARTSAVKQAADKPNDYSRHWAEAVLREVMATSLKAKGRLPMESVLWISRLGDRYGEFIAASEAGKAAVASRRLHDLKLCARFALTHSMSAKHQKQRDALDEKLCAINAAIAQRKAKASEREPITAAMEKLETAHERAEARLLKRFGVPAVY